MTWYVTDKREYLAASRDVGQAFREIVGNYAIAMTAVEVKALIEDRAKVEIEATAVLPAWPRSPARRTRLLQQEVDAPHRADLVAVRHVQQVQVGAEDAEAVVVQRRDDLARRDLVLDHVVGHDADPSPARIALRRKGKCSEISVGSRITSSRSPPW